MHFLIFLKKPQSVVKEFFPQCQSSFISACDDGVCEVDSGETCTNCPADCGSCLLEEWQLALVIVAGIIAIGLILCIVVVSSYRQGRIHEGCLA
jgi:hypothetical protein